MPFSALFDPKCFHTSSPATTPRDFPSSLTDTTHWQIIHTATPQYFLVSGRRLAFPHGKRRFCQWCTCVRATRHFYLWRKNLEQCLVHLGANGCWLRQDKGTLVLTNITTLQIYRRGYKHDYFHLLPSLKDAVSIDSKISFVLSVLNES